MIASALNQLGIMATLVKQVAPPVELWVVRKWGPAVHAGLATLSEQEHMRADRFQSDDLRNRYHAAHIALRCIAEHRFGVPAKTQRYEAGAYGKPQLMDCPHAHVSLSYAGDRVLIGVGTKALGVDMEMLRPIADATPLAALYYSPRERSLLAARALDSQGFDRSFLRIWTRKEACIKALGLGIAECELSQLECGESGTGTVRVGESQLRTCTILHECSRLISWAWRV